MTKEELKQAIDNYLGMVGELGEGYGEHKIIYKSPTGIKLFDFIIGDYDDGWQFGGHSTPVPESWKVLNRIHKVEKS